MFWLMKAKWTWVWPPGVTLFESCRSFRSSCVHVKCKQNNFSRVLKWEPCKWHVSIYWFGANKLGCVVQLKTPVHVSNKQNNATRVQLMGTTTSKKPTEAKAGWTNEDWFQRSWSSYESEQQHNIYSVSSYSEDELPAQHLFCKLVGAKKKKVVH